VVAPWDGTNEGEGDLAARHTEERSPSSNLNPAVKQSVTPSVLLGQQTEVMAQAGHGRG
jgi:hypothetical protein